ncbi:MAG TPA: hypothetical protein VFE58_17230, partial [Tepidisphaeraceae bacterium]|nr:hypothetical protein [Tepidisphaeraceae bacterium]
PNASPRASISSLAFIIKNIVRPLGLRTLNLPCLLTGTGMAFPWHTIRSAPLASSNIVEDMQLGLDLSLAGHSPRACPSALLIGTIENKSPIAFRQRTRWEHGHLATLLHNTPRLLLASLQQRRPELLALALEVSVPPIALLVLLIFLSLLACTAATIFLHSSPIPVLILTLSTLTLITCLFLSWARFARDRIPLRTLAAVPFYILWKLPLYLAFFTHRERNWIRTTRPPVEPAAPVHS